LANLAEAAHLKELSSAVKLVMAAVDVHPVSKHIKLSIRDVLPAGKYALGSSLARSQIWI
jgi:hypothetical protein